MNATGTDDGDGPAVTPDMIYAGRRVLENYGIEQKPAQMFIDLYRAMHRATATPERAADDARPGTPSPPDAPP